MKNMHPKNTNRNVHLNTHKHIPENKDDIDSRESEEQIVKGDNITHNTKEVESIRKKVGKKK